MTDTLTAAAYAAADTDDRAIMLETISPLDMRVEAAAILTRGDDIEIHTVDGVTVLWIPECDRAGCCINGETLWTDATSPEDAAQRYINDDMRA